MGRVGRVVWVVWVWVWEGWRGMKMNIPVTVTFTLTLTVPSLLVEALTPLALLLSHPHHSV